MLNDGREVCPGAGGVLRGGGFRTEMLPLAPWVWSLPVVHRAAACPAVQGRPFTRFGWWAGVLPRPCPCPCPSSSPGPVLTDADSQGRSFRGGPALVSAGSTAACRVPCGAARARRCGPRDAGASAWRCTHSRFGGMKPSNDGRVGKGSRLKFKAFTFCFWRGLKWTRMSWSGRYSAWLGYVWGERFGSGPVGAHACARLVHTDGRYCGKGAL